MAREMVLVCRVNINIVNWQYFVKKYTLLKLKDMGKLFDMDYAIISQVGKRYQTEICFLL